jgi:hypothetical protein
VCYTDKGCDKVHRIRRASKETATRPAHTLDRLVAELGISMTNETVIDSVLVQYVFASFTYVVLKQITVNCFSINLIHSAALDMSHI